MLDIALEVPKRWPLRNEAVCFNPSYAGYCSGSMQIVLTNLISINVSILLMLDIALEVNRIKIEGKGFN